MSTASKTSGCARSQQLYAYALGALSASEARDVEEHVPGCSGCQQALQQLHRLVDTSVSRDADVLHPPASLWGRVAERIGSERDEAPGQAAAARWVEPEWAEVAPGISCKLLATDSKKNIVSMLVRLAPGMNYPPHTHAGVEELHLLDGELWIDDRKLSPGDYNRAEPGSKDARVWSETGCTCVLITSVRDILH